MKAVSTPLHNKISRSAKNLPVFGFLLLVCYCDIDSDAELWHKNQEAEFRNPSWRIYCVTFNAIQNCIAKISLRKEVHTALITKIFVNYLVPAHRRKMNRRSEYKFTIWNCKMHNCSSRHQNIYELFALCASIENKLISFNAGVWLPFTHLHSTYGNNTSKI